MSRTHDGYLLPHTMTDTLYYAQDTLDRGGYTVERTKLGEHDALLFENDAYLGFVVAYPDAQALLAGRHADERAFLARYTPDLRAASDKAWNTYFVWLAEASPTPEEASTLAQLEEDLSGARKIAVADVQSPDDADIALINLLRFQHRTQLGRVDIPTEIRKRTPEIDSKAVDAFLTDPSVEHAKKVARIIQNLPS